jgi:hypothetical protein
MKLYTLYTPSHEVFFENYFLKTLPNEFELIVGKANQECLSGSFYQSGWETTCFRKVQLFLKACEQNMGDVFIYSDVDIQFFGKIKETLLEELGDYDIACQNDTRDVYCSGFFICRANERTLSMFQKMVENYYLEDQHMLNEYIHLCKSKFLSYKFLTIANVTGRVWDPSQIDVDVPESLLMHHANFTSGVENKIKLLELVKSKIKNE